MVSYKKQERFTLHEHLDSPWCLVRSVFLIIVVFCAVFLCLVSLRLVSCVLKCGQCLWIVFVLCLVYSNVASVSGLSLSCVLCTQMWPVSLDCLFMMPFLVFTNVYLYSICVVMLLVSFQTLFCCIVYISDMYTDKVIIINTKDHITQTLVTLDHIPQTLVTLNDFRLSCLAHLSLLFPIILPLFGFPIF